MTSGLKAFLAEQDDFLTYRRALILASLCEEGEHSVKSLAGALGLWKSVVSRSLRALEIMHLIYRREDPSNRRVDYFYPTKAGLARLAAMEAQFKPAR